MNTEIFVRETGKAAKTVYQTRWAWKAAGQIAGWGAVLILFVATHRHHIAHVLVPQPAVMQTDPPAQKNRG